MSKGFVIYDNYDIYCDVNMTDAKENLIYRKFEDNDTITVTDNYGIEVELTVEKFEKTLKEEEIYDECDFINQLNFESAITELKFADKQITTGIIALANLGRWNGRCKGYKEYDNLQDIAYTSCDYERIYVDRYKNLCKKETHHDGNNYIVYRMWKECVTDKQKENFLEKQYNGTLTTKDISRYTKRIGDLFW
jgi:hypothetical protein